MSRTIRRTSSTTPSAARKRMTHSVTENGTAEKSLPAKACHGRTSALQRKFITALFSRSRKYAASHASEMSSTAWRAGHSRQSDRNVIFFFSVVSISGILHRPAPDDNR